MLVTAEINLQLHPKQGTALETEGTEILYGGAAGGGKSHLMRVALIIWCAEIPGLQCYLFRRHSNDLEKNHVEGPKGFRAILASWAGAGLCKIVEGQIRFWNGSKIYLCHCKDEKDIYQYQGAEMHVLAIDEATHFTHSMYRFLRSRVRAPGLNLPEKYKGKFPKILLGSNPGNIGHHWVKSTFIDPAPPLKVWRTTKEEGGMLRQFIPALLEDNPSMQEDDPGYEDRLHGLGSPQLVKAMRYGDWNVVAGAFFSDWPTAVTISPFNIPQHWTKFRSFDWGSSKPFSVGWWAVSDGQDTGIPRGALVRYREWYGARGDNEGLKMTVEEVAEGIIAREGLGEEIAYSVADPALWKQDGGPSMYERFYNCGVNWQPADNSRIAGWNEMRARFRGVDGAPLLYAFTTCLDSLRTIPALMHDEHRPEDVDTDGEDHAADEWRYACMSRPLTTDKAEKDKPLKGMNQMTYNDLLNLELAA